MEPAPHSAWHGRAPIKPKPQHITARCSHRTPSPKFGGRTTGFLSFMEANPLGELVFKDVTAFNIPKIALTRTWKERIDTATLELSNTAVTLVSSLFLPKLIRKGMQRMAGFRNPLDLKKLEGEISAKDLLKTADHIKLARLGTAFAFFFPFASAFWAVPFFRNWLTLKRTNSADFESLIGFDNVKKEGPQRTVEEEKAFQKQRTLQILGSGLGLGVLSFLGFGLAARKTAQNGAKPLTQWLTRPDVQKKWRFLFDQFDLKGKGGNQIDGKWATLTMWSLPAYFGWIHAARSGNERRERMIQTGNALLWWFAAPRAIAPLWQKAFMKATGGGDKLHNWSPAFKKSIEDNLLPGETFRKKFEQKLKNLSYDDLKHFRGTEEERRKLESLKNKKYLSELGVTISSLGLTQLVNFKLTEYNIKQRPEANASATPNPTALPSEAENTVSSPLSAPIHAAPGTSPPEASLPVPPSPAMQPAQTHPVARVFSKPIMPLSLKRPTASAMSRMQPSLPQAVMPPPDYPPASVLTSQA